MRWESLRVLPLDEAAAPESDRDALFGLPTVVRTFDTPQFADMTFYEVQARSILNRVPAASRMPFRWTINPYRGCSHACRYCFARNTHTYLGLDAGLDFDREIVVKVNAPELLRRELAKSGWRGESVAMGTNVDCYQRAEGRYRLMPGILRALTEAANPFSILTKGSLILRDLELLRDAAAITDVSAAVSVGSVDQVVWRDAEPGTPGPHRRLEVCRTLNRAGVRCGVLMAPILPGLTDSPRQLDATVRSIAASGARFVTPIVLHLRPGAREWFMAWLESVHPELVERYRQLYGRSAYAPKTYQDDIAGQVRELAQGHGLGRDPEPARARSRSGGLPASGRRFDGPASRSGRSATTNPEPAADQLALPLG